MALSGDGFAEFSVLLAAAAAVAVDAAAPALTGYPVAGITPHISSANLFNSNF